MEAAGGACCFIAGILAASLGSLLTASGWITGVEMHPWIRGAGTGLLVVTIPLIIFAGFCLDWAEQGQGKTPCDPKQAQRGAAAWVQIVAVATVLGAALLGLPSFTRNRQFSTCRPLMCSTKAKCTRNWMRA